MTFAGQNYGTTSAPQVITVTNNGTASSIVNGVAIVPGQFSPDFPVTNDHCTGSTLAAGGSCTVSVSFYPALTGNTSATLQIASVSPGLPALVASVPLFGVSISGVATFSPTSLTFPATPVRTASAPLTVTVANTGNGPMGVGPISLDSPIFAETNNCAAVLAAGANCAIQVTYRPISAGALQQGSMVVMNTAPGANVFVDLLGTAITAPGITLCPTSLAFGNQAVGTSSSPQTVTISNTGTSNLSLNTIAASGNFAQSNTCGLPVALPPATACNVSVTFTPAAAGTRTGTLSITDNAASSPQTVALNGKGSSASSSLAPGIAGSNPQEGNALASLGITDYPKNLPLMPRVKEAFAKSALAFEAGEESAGGQVRFLARGNGYTMKLAANEALVAVKSRNSKVRTQVPDKDRLASVISPRLPLGTNRGAQTPDSVLRMQFVGANLNSRGRGLDELPGKSNYFLGNDPAKWRVGVPNFAQVKYERVYPGTDLIFYGKRGELEFDFVVTPGRDPRKIRLAFPGADKLSIRSDGDLVISADGEEFRIHKPTVYQPVRDNLGGSTKSLRGRYVLHNRHEVSFEVAVYDHHQPLVIDPVLVYSTYLGGSGLDEAYGIAVDNAGNAYIAGVTSSTDFPVANAFQSAVGPVVPYSTHAFVTKMSPTGTVSYSTFLGGNGWDQAQAIAGDQAGNAYITGYTDSKNFPLQNPIQPELNFGYDAFVTELNASGSALVFSTFLGGNGEDAGFGIAVDSSGNTYVAGVTGSTDFPTTPGAFQTVMTDANCSSNTAFCGDAFVTKINSGGTSLGYSTRLGGSLSDAAKAIAIDAQGNAYVTGTTQSPDFPTTAGAYQTGLGDYSDVFVTKLNPAGTVLVYSTHLLADTAGGIAVNPSGNVYVTGGVATTLFPTTPNAFQPHRVGTQSNANAFVTMFHPAGCALAYSTLLGGSSGAGGNAIALDSAGNAYVTGATSSTDFPTSNATQPSLLGNTNAFVSEISADGSALPFSTFLGGSGGYNPVAVEQGTSIALDTSGDLFVAGATVSTDFPTLNAAQGTYGGDSDAFVTKINSTNVPSPGLAPRPLPSPINL